MNDFLRIGCLRSFNEDIEDTLIASLLMLLLFYRSLDLLVPVIPRAESGLLNLILKSFSFPSQHYPIESLYFDEVINFSDGAFLISLASPLLTTFRDFFIFNGLMFSF